MQEIWKDIPTYEGKYQVSNLGNVKSLNYNKTKIEKLLIPRINMRGYYQFILCKDGKTKTFTSHQLVAITFLNHTPDGTQKLVVDHINDNKLDNRVENLQIITQRENAYKTQGEYSSQYKGVNWFERLNKWCAKININGKSKHLGYFIDEYEAHLEYQEALKEITKGK